MCCLVIGGGGDVKMVGVVFTEPCKTAKAGGKLVRPGTAVSRVVFSHIHFIGTSFFVWVGMRFGGGGGDHQIVGIVFAGSQIPGRRPEEHLSSLAGCKRFIASFLH